MSYERFMQMHKDVLDANSLLLIKKVDTPTSFWLFILTAKQMIECEKLANEHVGILQSLDENKRVKVIFDLDLAKPTVYICATKKFGTLMDLVLLYLPEK